MLEQMSSMGSAQNSFRTIEGS